MELGESPDLIMDRLRSIGKSHCTYLCYRKVLTAQSQEALKRASAAVDASLNSDWSDDLLPNVVPEDDEMVDYEDSP